MDNLGAILWGNIFFGYDLIIFFVASVESIFFIFSWASAKSLRKEFWQESIRTGNVHKAEAISNINSIAYKALVKKRDTARLFYSLFEKIASIFPMLGILGTVLALLPMVNDIENMQNNFFIALTSTGWGVFFAIIFAGICDAFLSPRMEENYDLMERFLDDLHSEEST